MGTRYINNVPAKSDQRLVAVHSTPDTARSPGNRERPRGPEPDPPAETPPVAIVLGPVPRDPLEKLSARYVEMVPEHGPGTQATSSAVATCRFGNV